MADEERELTFHDKPVNDMTKDELIAALHEAAATIADRNRKIQEYYDRLTKRGAYGPGHKKD